MNKYVKNVMWVRFWFYCSVNRVDKSFDTSIKWLMTNEYNHTK